MRDYAQKKGLNEKRPPLKKTSRSELAPAWVWTTLGIGLGLGIAILLAIKLYPLLIGIDRNLATQQELEQDEVTTLSPAKNTKAKSLETAAVAPQPKFDFYTLLPSIEEDIDAPQLKTEHPEKIAYVPQPPPPSQSVASVASTSTTSPVSPKKLKTESHSDSFVLQAAVFQSKEPAETLKAQLILQGFETKIEPYQKDSASATWYRVYLGPFEQIAEAKQAQSALLRTAQVDSFIIKNKA